MEGGGHLPALSQLMSPFANRKYFSCSIFFFLLVSFWTFLKVYFEFHVQFLVSASCLKSGAHNIFPLRNLLCKCCMRQIEEMEIWSRQKGRVSRDSHKGTLLFSQIYSLSEFCNILGYPLELHCMYITGELLLLYHSAWCATYQDFTLFVSIFLFSARGRGKRSIEKPSFSALLFSFFLSRVYCHVIPHRVLLSRKNLGESCIRT